MAWHLESGALGLPEGGEGPSDAASSGCRTKEPKLEANIGALIITLGVAITS